MLGVHSVAAEENLEALVVQALEQNPAVAVIESRWQILQHRVAAAGSLDDPMLMLGVRSVPVGDPLDFRSEPMTQKVIGLSQKIPYAGKRGTRTAAARSDAEAARWLLAERKLELAQMVRETGYRIYAIDKSIELTQQTLQLLDDLIILAETRYGVGKGPIQAVFSAQVQRSRMQEMLLKRQQQRKTLQALFNELLNRPQSTEVATFPEPQLQPITAAPDILLQRALVERPLLHSLNAEYQASLSSRRLAELDFYPDVTLNVEYMQRDRLDSGMGGDDMYSLSLSFNLPVQRARRRAAEHAAASQSAMVTAQLHQVRNSIEGGISQRLAELEQRYGQIQLYADAILPQAEQSVEASVAAFQVDRIDFSMLLDEQMALFDYQTEYYQLLADYQISLAQLRTLVGGEL
ncbi:MAG: TolC family protein [Pelovirga sp.]